MMKKNNKSRILGIGTAALLMLTIGLTACGGGGGAAPASSESSAEKQTFRLGMVAAMDSVQHKGALHFAEKAKELTDGAVEITVFPASQLGGDEALGQDLSRGNLDFAFLNQGSLAGMDPLLDFHYLPYIVQNFAQADELYFGDGIIPQTMRETLGKLKIRVLGFYELEFRGLSNSKAPVTDVKDIAGLKLRVPGSKAIMAFFKNAGAQPVSIPMPELYTALQQKTVDGQDNGVIITFDNKFQEANKYYTRTNHVYATGVICASEDVWQKLSPEHQSAIEEAAKLAQEWEVAEERKLTDNYIAQLREEGIEVVDLTPEQLEGFREVGVKSWEELHDVYGEERINKLREEVEAVKDLQ